MIYLFLFLLLILCTRRYACTDHRSGNYNIWLFVVSFALIAVASARYEIGADTTLSYMPNYSDYPNLSRLTYDDLFFSRYQPGWTLFCAMCKSISPKFYVFQILHALYVNICIIFFLRRNSNNVFGALLVYFALNYLEFNTECLRESLAVATVLIAFECFKSKKYILTCILAFIAFNFHISAMFALVIPLLYRIKFTQRSFFVIVLIALASPFIYQMIPDQAQIIINITGQDNLIDSYNTRDFSTTLNANFYIMHVFQYVVIPMLLVWYNIKNGDGKFVGFAYAFSILQMVAVLSYAFYRIANYIAPFYWIFVADCIYIYFGKSSIRDKGLVFFICSIVGLYICQGRLLGQDSGRINSTHRIYERYFPYKTWLFDDNKKKKM